jgi:hypothetical protein
MGEGENGFDVINSRYVYLKKIDIHLNLTTMMIVEFMVIVP